MKPTTRKLTVNRRHKCKTCGHEWYSITDNQRPFCGLCVHIEMAKRHASLRGYTLKIKTVPKTLDLSTE